MKKNLIILLALTCFVTQAFAQSKLDDIGRIVINTYLPEAMPLPTEAKNLLVTKLSQITTNNGIGGSDLNPRFIITAAVNVGSKDIIAGPPQLIAQNVDITLFIGDAISNTKFADLTLSLKGVGTNENKAFIDAFKTLNPKNKDIASFLDEGKNKIIAYYASQCEIICTQAKALATQYKFDEAIFNLMTVPEVCTTCYTQTRALANTIFQQKAKAECAEKLKQAKVVWATEPNETGALKASEILQSIIPSDECRQSMLKLATEIKTKLKADQQQAFEFARQELSKRYNLEENRVKAQKEIALAHIAAQPKTITYNNIYWR
jgi:hypothetical protein